MNLKHLAAFVALLVLIGGAVSYALAADSQKVYLPLVSCPTCAGSTTAPTNPTPMPTPNPAGYTSRMIELVNQVRAAVGCPAVTPHASLMKGAQDWTNHIDATGDYRHSPSGYYQQRGYPVGSIVENVGIGGTAEDGFQAWMESPAHKSNIEFCMRSDNPSYTPTQVYEIGVGYTGGYWTLAIAVREP